MAITNFDLPVNNLTQIDSPTVMPWKQWFQRIQTIASSLQQSGTTAQRPTTNLWIGRRYFDTDLGMPIWVTAVSASGVATWSGATGSAYAEISSTVTQNVANILLAQAVTYNSTEIASGISIVSNSRITPAKPGIYSLSFYAQTYVSAGNASLDFWLTKNGVNQPNTLIRITMAASTDNFIGPQTYMVNAVVGDYFEIMMNGTSVNAGILAIAAGVTPTRPMGPSIIITMNLDSAV